MAKDKITDYDSVASNNLDVGGISVAEGMLPSGVNNSIRELMSHQKEAFGSGTPLYVDQTNNRVGVNNAAPATALDVTGSVNISNSSGATLKLTSTDTTGADTELLGQIDFVSSDSSGGSAGTQARIKGVYEDNGDSSGIAFLTGNSTGSGSPTLNEVMRIRHEGRVGIGTASPSRQLEIYDDGTNGQAVLAITAQNTENSRIMFADPDDNNIGIIDYNHSDDSMRFIVNNSERLRILSTGGLTFNGDTAAANALDDYEEGTWTPTANLGTVSGTNCTYRKIGSQVTVWGLISSFSDRTSSNAVQIGGLPFSVDASADDVAVGSAMWSFSNVDGGTVYIDSTTKFQFYAGTSSSSFVALSHNSLNTSSALVYLCATYVTT